VKKKCLHPNNTKKLGNDLQLNAFSTNTKVALPFLYADKKPDPPSFAVVENNLLSELENFGGISQVILLSPFLIYYVFGNTAYMVFLRFPSFKERRIAGEGKRALFLSSRNNNLSELSNKNC
jgi:hypothetical protein